MCIRVHVRSVFRLAAVFVPVLAQCPALSQTPAWKAGVAKVTVRADLNRQPGTAFVVALEDGTAYLVTSAHVVEGDDNPRIKFGVSPPTANGNRSIVLNAQSSEEHGIHALALLRVNSPPAGLTVLQPSISPAPAQGGVFVAGYPASIGGVFTVTDTTIGGFKEGDLVLNFETDEGYSGGPVVRQDGTVVGLVYGHRARFGLALPSSQVRTYLQAYVSWGAKSEQAAPESARPIEKTKPSIDFCGLITSALKWSKDEFKDIKGPQIEIRGPGDVWGYSEEGPEWALQEKSMDITGEGRSRLIPYRGGTVYYLARYGRQSDWEQAHTLQKNLAEHIQQCLPPKNQRIKTEGKCVSVWTWERYFPAPKNLVNFSVYLNPTSFEVDLFIYRDATPPDCESK